jgi:hypothetical protein
MILVILALMLMIFWVRALRITPEKYPSIDAEIILEWQSRLIKSYKRNSVLFFIYFVLALLNGYWLNQTTTTSPDRHFFQAPAYFQIYTLGLLLYGIGALIYAVFQAIQNHRWAKQQGIYVQ